MIGESAALVAMLAICVTAYVFLFGELSTRVREHDYERIPCEVLQQGFRRALVVIIVFSVLLIVADVLASGGVLAPDAQSDMRVFDGGAGPFVLLLLALSTFANMAMAVFSIMIANYRKLIRYRAIKELGIRLNIVEEAIEEWKNCNAESFENLADSADPMGLADRIETITGMGFGVLPLVTKEGAIRTSRSKELGHDTKGIVKCLLDCRNIDLVASAEHGAKLSKRLHDKREAARGRFRTCVPKVWRWIVRGEQQGRYFVHRAIEGMSLAHADFSSANLTSARFVDCDLGFSSFANTLLKKAEFRKCNLAGCEFCGADCENVLFDECLIPDITYAGSANRDACENGDVGDRGLVEEDSPVRIDSRTNLEGVSFKGAQLVRAQFGADGAGAFSLANCSFKGADLQNAAIRNVALKDSTWMGCSVYGALFSNCFGARVGFADASLFDAKLKNCDFASANFARAEFTNAVLEHGRYVTGNFAGAVFDNTRLLCVKFTEPEFGKAVFSNGELLACRFENALADSIKLIGCKIVCCQFPLAMCRNWRVLNCDVFGGKFLQAALTGFSGVESNFRCCKFDESDMHKMRVRNVTFETCSFRNTRLGSSDFTGATIRDSHFVGADLRGALLTRAVVEGCLFEGVASCDSIDFTDAELKNVVFKVANAGEVMVALSAARSRSNVTVNGVRIDD